MIMEIQWKETIGEGKTWGEQFLDDQMEKKSISENFQAHHENY